MTSALRKDLLPLAILLLFPLVQPIWGRILSQCEAAKELERGGIERTFISTYVCIMKSESDFNTSKKTGPGHKASYAYGVFQISSDEWCSAYRKGGRCNAQCNDFLDDNIQDDIRCAKLIAAEVGFKRWKGWLKSCKHKPLPNVATCLRRRKRSIDVLRLMDGDDINIERIES